MLGTFTSTLMGWVRKKYIKGRHEGCANWSVGSQQELCALGESENIEESYYDVGSLASHRLIIIRPINLIWYRFNINLNLAHLFFTVVFILGICLALDSQKAIWRLPAVSLNFLPQVGHWIMPLASSAWAFYSAVNSWPLPALRPALNAALCCFHFGIFSSFGFCFVFLGF